MNFLIPGFIFAGCSATGKTADQEATSTPASGPEWSIIADTKVTHRTNVEGFIDKDNGITVGCNNEVYYTNDGGQTWTRSSGITVCRFSFEYVNENLIWSGGDQNIINFSKDGGKTWTNTEGTFPAGNKHSQISFLDEKTGWVASTTKFASTTDGGATWTEMKLPEGVKRIGLSTY